MLLADFHGRLQMAAHGSGRPCPPHGLAAVWLAGTGNTPRIEHTPKSFLPLFCVPFPSSPSCTIGSSPSSPSGTQDIGSGPCPRHAKPSHQRRVQQPISAGDYRAAVSRCILMGKGWRDARAGRGRRSPWMCKAGKPRPRLPQPSRPRQAELAAANGAQNGTN